MDKKEQLVTQLIRETLSGEVAWKNSPPPYSLSNATTSYVSVYFNAQYKGYVVGVYEMRHRQYTDVDEFYWYEVLGICLVNNNGIVTWKSEDYSPALKNLFEIASEQGSGINDLLAC